MAQSSITIFMALRGLGRRPHHLSTVEQTLALQVSKVTLRIFTSNQAYSYEG